MMNNAWKEIIATHASTLKLTDNNSFDARPELADSSWLAPLTSRTILKVSGDDALEFLHGQFSNDLKKLASGQWQLSSFSTPKGRLLAIFRIAKVAEDFYIVLPQNTSEAFQKRLTMFVMRSKVSIENLSDTMLGSAIAGPIAEQALLAQGIDVPAIANELSTSDSNDPIVLLDATDSPSYIVLAGCDKMNHLWQSTDASVLRTNENTWTLSQIEHGMPDVFDETQEQFVAQMMNLHVIGAVNFKKGCYPGQEVVARLQYLGKLKRRMYRFSTCCQTLPVPGSEIVLAGETAAAGKVASAAFSAEGEVELLAVMKVASVESDSALQLTSGETLKLLELPYAYAEESKAQ